MKRLALAVLCAAQLLLGAQSLAAQPARARIIVTVVDPSGAIIPDASVALVALDPGASATTIPPVKTTDKGLATIENLAPGRYSVTASFPGFELGLLKDVRLRSGDNKHVVVLPMQRLQSEVTVGRDAQAAAADPRARFGTALTREQIEALSDDPAEMQKQLQDMAGPNAIIRVDSFEGGQLPPKSQIKSIHITRDAFAAENHFAGALFIDIITQPGIGALRGGINYRLRDGSMSGRSPFTATKGPERSQNYGGGVSGPLLKNRASFSFNVNGGTSFDTPNRFVYIPGVGQRSEALDIRRPSDNVFAYGSFDYAITRDQTLRVSLNHNHFSSRNLGIGGNDEIERGYSNENAGTFFRIQEAGPLGRRFFTNTRLQVYGQHSDMSSVLEAPTYRIQDARTTGGAQMRGGRRSTGVNLQSDLDYVKGIQSVRTGFNLDAGSYRSDESSNYLGTYVFDSPDAFQQERPLTYTRRIGDPNVKYTNVLAGLYIQDDIRVRKNLTLSPGVRYEVQTHVRDYNNFGPRFGISWAPFKSGKTSFRGSVGTFYDWMNSGIYEQTLRVDGYRQRELNIANPSFPNPGNVGTITATNRYLLDANLPLARSTRVSFGVDQTISPRVRIGANVARTWGRGLWRGNNLNAPVNGVRPDPAFVNIVQVVGDAASRQYNVNVFSSFSLIAQTPGPPPAQGPRVNWKRISFNLNYWAGRFENNTDGPFAIPFSGGPAGEWGEVPGEIRHHRGNLGISAGVLKNLNANININAMTGMPYSITTGRDNNGDLVINDRPDGVGRNSAWTSGMWMVNGFFVYTINIGKATVSNPGGITGIMMRNGEVTVMTGGNAPPRYRLGIQVNVQNLTNHANYTGYSGVMTSPFFQQPTNVMGTRKVDISLNFSF
jgi:hypothetical protein